jgi:hypothetical protein
VNGNVISTIEGNTNTGGADGVYRKTRNITTTKFTFIHIEDLDTIENNINAILEPFNLEIGDKKLWAIAGLASVSITGAILYERLR